MQLSNQKRLQELRVGPAPLISESTFPLFQFYTLEMNLDTGLGWLDELKKLEKVDMRYRNHDISVSDCSWMVDNWPRLTSLETLPKA